MTNEEKIKTLNKHKREARGETRIEKQHSKGKLTAWERINLLFDKGTFIETDMLLEHRCNYFGMGDEKKEGDGVIAGYGLINGRTVCAYAQDFTVFGGSISEMNAKKISNIQNKALQMMVPIVGLFDSGGARVQEGVQGLSGHGDIFFNNVKASGKIPQISAIMGTCAGGASYSPALTDFVLMVEGISKMFITGPKVVEQAIGEVVSMEELGGTKVHSFISGMADKVVQNDEACIAYIKKLLGYLPDNFKDCALKRKDTIFTLGKLEHMREILPESNRRAFDIHEVIDCLADDGSVFEVKENFAKNIVTAFTRMDGRTVGIVANQSMERAGCIDIDAADKAARFIRICDSFNIPLLNLVDVPGFYPGKDQEQRGIIRHGAKMLYAYGESKVPKITVILRKGYGGAYLAMCSKELGADMVYAWPEAEMAVMGSKAAVEVIYRKASPEEREEKIKEYEEQFLNPYEASHMGYVDEIISPEETRNRVIRVLENMDVHITEKLPHGNIPL